MLLKARVCTSSTKPMLENSKVDQLQAELREASNAAAHWQARAVAAEQTVQRLLPAPKDEPEPEPPDRLVRVSWWKRLFS